MLSRFSDQQQNLPAVRFFNLTVGPLTQDSEFLDDFLKPSSDVGFRNCLEDVSTFVMRSNLEQGSKNIRPGRNFLKSKKQWSGRGNLNSLCQFENNHQEHRTHNAINEILCFQLFRSAQSSITLTTLKPQHCSVETIHISNGSQNASASPHEKSE